MPPLDTAYRSLANAQKIVDIVLGFHPDVAAQPGAPDSTTEPTLKQPFYNQAINRKPQRSISQTV